MSDWIQERPKRVKKRDIPNIPLMVLADFPPQESNIKGMSEIVVFDTRNTSKRWVVLATQTDIDFMVEAYKQQKPFFFVRNAGEEYANVQIAEAKSDE